MVAGHLGEEVVDDMARAGLVVQHSPEPAIGRPIDSAVEDALLQRPRAGILSVLAIAKVRQVLLGVLQQHQDDQPNVAHEVRREVQRSHEGRGARGHGRSECGHPEAEQRQRQPLPRKPLRPLRREHAVGREEEARASRAPGGRARDAKKDVAEPAEDKHNNEMAHCPGLWPYPYQPALKPVHGRVALAVTAHLRAGSLALVDVVGPAVVVRVRELPGPVGHEQRRV
mmetsp:Transcript_76821/g.212266  ORF Transcript_76821/g.212266 Transcript_76821/m.212266 type:complete len:227 (+) Transcript_76821:307-987(+)